MVTYISHPRGPEKGCCMLIYFLQLTWQWDLMLITNCSVTASCSWSSLLVTFRGASGGFTHQFMIVLQIPKYIVPLVSLHPCPFTALRQAGADI